MWCMLILEVESKRTFDSRVAELLRNYYTLGWVLLCKHHLPMLQYSTLANNICLHAR
jgi:hypothetical protein